MARMVERGFTVVELLVTAAVFSIITTGVLSMVASTYQRYANESSRNEVIWQGRAAIDLMVRELRAAGYPPANTHAVAGVTPPNSNLVATTFLTATGTQVVFEADLDDNRIVERVEYRLNGSTLKRSAVSKNANGSVPAADYQALATNINNGVTAVFTYATDPYGALPWPGNINSVGILLLLKTASPDPKNFQYQTLRFDGVAYRRNPDR